MRKFNPRDLGCAILLLTTACTSKPAAPAAPTAPAFTPVDYSQEASWLCRPGHEDNCTADFTTTIISPSGKTKIEKWQAASDPKIDCFYIYPTISADNQPNSDLVPGEKEEIAVARQQIGRFASVCRLFVPMYRQSTVATMVGQFKSENTAMRVADVEAAWAYYLAHDNNGRGVLLIGHSQGAGMVHRLVSDQIDGKPAASVILSAMMIGGAVRVPEGKDVGGDFKSFPLCHSASQLHCAITYSSFRDTAPPDKTTRFGKPRDGLVAACTNPAALGGGSGPLHAYMPTDFYAPPWHVIAHTKPQLPWVKGKTITTPYVSLPGLLSAACKRNEFATYLGIALHAKPKSARATDIPGDIEGDKTTRGEWGLHIDDMLLPQGNLIEIVGAQAAAYQAERPTSP